MGRLEVLRTHMNYELGLIYNARNRMDAATHLYGVSFAAVILAKKRGQDPELAAMAAMLHDIAEYRGGFYETHAVRSANIAREILETLHLTSPEETDAICEAIAVHDRKDERGGPLEELLKDADVFQHSLYDPSEPVREKEQARYEALCLEFGLHKEIEKNGAPE